MDNMLITKAEAKVALAALVENLHDYGCDMETPEVIAYEKLINLIKNRWSDLA